MRKKLLIFLGIFIFMIIPKNVFAEEVFPWYANINGETFNSGNTGYHNWYGITLNPSASSSFNVSIQSYDYDSLGLDESFTKYPYILLYFQTWNTKEQIGLTKNDSCSQSCFKPHNIGLKYIGDDISSGRHMYVLILQAMKWQLDCGSGNGQCIYKIDDVFTITNNNTSSSTNKTFIFYNAVLSDNSNIISDDSINFSNLINNASSNANSIMSNANQNRQQIINNQNTNTQNIINNQNTNQQQTHNDMNDLKNKQDTTNQKLDDVNNTLSSEDAPSNNDVSSKTNDWASKNASTGPISGMVLMPITLLNAYTSGMNSTCSPYNLGNLYGTDIILPCINVSNYLGSTLWGVIDILFSGLMIFAMGKKFVKIFNDFTNLRDNQIDELYGGGK